MLGGGPEENLLSVHGFLKAWKVTVLWIECHEAVF